MENQDQYLLALAMTKGLGPVNVKNMIAYCGSAHAIFESSPAKLSKAPGIGQKLARLALDSPMLAKAEKEIAFCGKHDIQIMSYLHEAYPNALKFIHDAPLFLFQKGAINLNQQTNLAIVGTRKATAYGQALAEEFSQFFAERGINVVSGLAYGIDITAHRAALAVGGKTTAVLAHGLDMMYPAVHKSKALKMLESGGWVSEYFTGTKPEPPFFPARNRIISGICQGVLVVEAGEKGGALITARTAFEQNRQVYAIPGRLSDPYSQGCHRLIAEDIARLVTRPQQILDDLEIDWQHHDDLTEQLNLFLPAPEILLTAEEAKILNFLAQGEAVVDQIGQATGIPMARLQSLLLSMEFKSLVRQLPGKKFLKI